jgi:hypothetical protein
MKFAAQTSSFKGIRQLTAFTMHSTKLSPCFHRKKTIHKHALPPKASAKTAKPRLSPGSRFLLKRFERSRYFAFFNRFITPASECSFIAVTASPRTFFISALTAWSFTLSQSPAVASNTSPNPICLAGTFSFAPPCGPFFCSINPALCSSRKVLRTITALSCSDSAIADEVCIASASVANTANTRTLN